VFGDPRLKASGWEVADADAPPAESRLHAALELWASVLSRPEPELAFIGFGKRDAPFDYRLPIAERVRSRRGEERDARGAYRVVGLNDQHAYVQLAKDDPLEASDVITFGISHRCTAFDKWRLIPLVNGDYTVINGIRTFF
jgi:D-serine deaminase-like pyridoxal phosphate-dependent protein